MQINNTIFNVDLKTIIQELRSQLTANHIHLLNKVVDSGDDIMVCCPYHKEGQEKRPSAGIRKSDGMFHCFRADTEIITYWGIRKIGDMSGKIVTILNGEGKWETVVFRDYGVANLIKLTLSQDGKTKSIYTTAEHEWFVNKYNRLYKTTQLKQGMFLDGVICKPVDFNIDIDGLIHGIIYGDGTRNIHYQSHRVGNNKRVFDKNNPIGVSYRINIPKFNKKSGLLSYFKDLDNWSVSSSTLNNKEYWRVTSRRFPLSSNLKKPPELYKSRDYLMSFMAGYFACDGSYDLMSIYSSKVDELIQIRDICINCGISVRDVVKSVRTTNLLEKSFGGNLFLYSKSLPDKFFLVDDKKETKYSRFRWKVVSVEFTDIYENVYCCETSTGSFVLADNILTHNCLACGETHSLPEVISYCFGYNDPLGKEGYKWLCKNFLALEVENREDIKIDLARNHITDKGDVLVNCNHSKSDGIAEGDLDKYRYVHPYMYERGLNDNIIELFDIGYDRDTDSITFPVRYWGCINFGYCLFVARRTVGGKRFNIPKGIEKPLYGLYELNVLMTQDFFDDKPTAIIGFEEIYVCEGVFDCLRLWCNGKVAVAGFGCLFSDYQIMLLEGLPTRHLILATDNDKAGRKAREYLKSKIKGKIITEAIIPEGKKDIGELTDYEIQHLEEDF